MSDHFHQDLIAMLPKLRVQALALTRNRAQADDLVQDCVVRALAGPWRMRGAALAQRIELPFPEGLDPGRAGLVLFAESAADASPLQSLQQRLSDCLVPAG